MKIKKMVIIGQGFQKEKTIDIIGNNSLTRDELHNSRNQLRLWLL